MRGVRELADDEAIYILSEIASLALVARNDEVCFSTVSDWFKIMHTPIAFFIFKRPKHTAKVFEQIRKARPLKLFVVADGGKDEEEWKKCHAARAIVEEIDWPCDIIKNYSDKNLGCKVRISSGIDWVFQNTERAVLIEDDTLPDESFFRFAEELLERFKDNSKIMHISGINFQQKNTNFKSEYSYYFSRLPHIWGWATWKRAWKNYDIKMDRWPEFKKSKKLYEIFKNPIHADYWEYRFDEVYERRFDPAKDTWDAQWAFACLASNGLAVNPCYNLVTNIGAGADATTINAKKKEKRLTNLPLDKINFPLVYPQEITVNEVADSYTHWLVWGVNLTFRQKLISLLKFKTPTIYNILKKIYNFYFKN